MHSILDIVRDSHTRFWPTSTREYFALQLARALSDRLSVKRYIELTADYPELVLSGAFRRLLAKGIPSSPLPTFIHELQHGTFQGPRHYPEVLGLRIERRVTGIVLLTRIGIGFSDTRELSFERSSALATLTSFLTRTFDDHPEVSVALETPESESDSQRVALVSQTKQLVREAGLPLWEVGRGPLLESFAEPGPKSLQAVRAIASTIWPALATKHTRSGTLLDAAAVALFVHVARQFQNSTTVVDSEPNRDVSA